MCIHELHREGLSKSAVARQLGIDRGTVAKYWDQADVEKVSQYKKRPSKLDAYHEFITNRLSKYPELSAESLFREISERGYEGSKRSLRRFVATVRPRHSRVYRPVEVLPGEQAQVDWGHLGTIVENGQRKKLYVFVFTLSWSRAMYAEFITSLGMPTFAGCIHRALRYIGGVPSEILFDNAKTVVVERIGHIVQFNEELLRLALRYGFTPKACWVSDPESKGRVESNVKYVKNGFYYGLEYDGLTDLGAKCQVWLDQVAQKRLHGTTKEVPAEQLEFEKPYLKQFIEGDGPSGIIQDRKVSKHGLISVDQNSYSVPSNLQRKRIQIRRFETGFDVLDAGQPVCRHSLQPGKGKRAVMEEHYPEHMQRKRRTHPLQAEFEALCPQAQMYLQELSHSTSGSLREQMQQIVALSETYTGEELAAAMKRSLEYSAFGYGRLKRILEFQRKAPNSLPNPAKTKVAAARHGEGSMQRDPSYYAEVAL